MGKEVITAPERQNHDEIPSSACGNDSDFPGTNCRSSPAKNERSTKMIIGSGSTVFKKGPPKKYMCEGENISPPLTRIIALRREKPDRWCPADDNKFFQSHGASA